ncbi:MAG: DUF4390 domain-containing protein [Methylococcaceae bacterium]
MRQLVLIFSLVIGFNAAHANEFAAEIKHAETVVQHGDYILTADLDYHLSPQANEALQNGVPLCWKINVKLQQQHDFWFNQTLSKYALRYRLQYHALLNMYRVRNENTGEVQSFSTLAAALNVMATVRDVRVIAAKDVLADAHYSVGIQVIFEDEKLPLPLQTQVIANPQWQLSSDWTYWNMLKIRNYSAPTS